jgi:hypothetical protein
MQMRTGRQFCSSVGICIGAALLAYSPSAGASKAEPAPQWALDAAKTPTPATAGDASAVMLADDYHITVDEQNHAIERERFAIRILKPQGRRWANCEIEYDTDEKLDYIRAWTIAADGRQLEAMDSDFSDHGAYSAPVMQFSERIREVKPPGADPGSVVVCEMEGHLRPYIDSEDWQVQYSIPVVEESLELALAPGGHYAEAWGRFNPVKPIETGPDDLRWEIHDVPAVDLENLRATPAWLALAGRMEIKWGDMAVRGVDNQWRAIGEWQDQLETHRPDPTPEIAAEARQLASGAPDLYGKLSAITQYIQKNIRYFIVEKGIGGWQAHYADEIFRNRYGDCKDKTTLLISMLQAIGIRALYLHVDSERGVIDPAMPSLWGNHMITAIELPDGENDPRLMARVKAASGKTLLIFDPTDEVTPVGRIRGELQGAYGNLIDGANSQVLAMPVLAPDSAGMEREGKFVLAADGSLKGDIDESLTGDDAASQRWMLKDLEEKDLEKRLEQRVGAQLPGVTLTKYGYLHAGDLDKPLQLTLNLSTDMFAHASGPLLLLRPRVLGSDARDVPDVMEGKPRKYPIELGHPGRWHDSYDIALPAGYAVDETPDPVDLDLDFASYHATTTAKGSVLHYEREYVVRQPEIPAARAADFRKLESTILADESGAAVLKKQ